MSNQKIDSPEEGKSWMIEITHLKHVFSILRIFLFFPVICIFITGYYSNSKYKDLGLIKRLFPIEKTP